MSTQHAAGTPGAFLEVVTGVGDSDEAGAASRPEMGDLSQGGEGVWEALLKVASS